jgi:hypothetical protein
MEEGLMVLLRMIQCVLYVASLIHVCIESVRMHDGPFRHTVMVGLCAWPIGYLCWVFWWPGTLRKWLFSLNAPKWNARGPIVLRADQKNGE